jgi:hypothetical protein
MNDSDIEPFEDHDDLVKKASKKIIRVEFSDLPSMSDLMNEKVIVKWEQFTK